MSYPNTGYVGVALACVAISFPTHARTELELTLRGNAIAQDNFYFQETNNQERAIGLQFSPSISISRSGTVATSQISAGGTSTNFNTNPEDDYFDSFATAGFDFKLGINTLQVEARYMSAHDPFGSTRTEDTSTFDRELDTWQQTRLKLGWVRQGMQRGDIFTNVTLRLASKDYTSNRDQTRFLDRQSQIYNGLIGIRITPKTGIFVSGRFTDYSFDEKTAPLRRSGSTTAAYGGFRWSATARTEGDLRFGIASRGDDGFDTRFWEAELRWEPRHNHLLTANTGRRFDPSYREDTQFFDSRTIDLSWVYYLNRRINTRIDANTRYRDFVGTELSDRSRHLTAKLIYEIDNGLSIFGSVRRSARKSNQSGYNYDANTFSFGFESRIN